MEDFMKKTRHIKNRMCNMAETNADKYINQLVLIELPRLWKSIIQTLTHLNATMIFDELMAHLLTDSNKRKVCNAQFGGKKVLMTTFGKKATV